MKKQNIVTHSDILDAIKKCEKMFEFHFDKLDAILSEINFDKKNNIVSPGMLTKDQFDECLNKCINNFKNELAVDVYHL